MMQICGIYLIKNKVNSHCYVGSSVNIHRRINDHFCGRGSSIVWRAVNKYGMKNFVFLILQKCEVVDLPKAEAKWFRGIKPEYNLDGLTVHGGRLMSEDSKKKIGQSKIGRPRLDMIGNKRLLGHHHSAKFCADVSKRMLGNANTKGFKFSEQTKTKKSIAMLGNQHLLGHKHTVEARVKMSAALFGNQRMFGHKHTVKTKAQMSASQKLAWERRKI
jgi:group I intron endonuclease